jgi:hypothetical protein
MARPSENELGSAGRLKLSYQSREMSGVLFTLGGGEASHFLSLASVIFLILIL